MNCKVVQFFKIPKITIGGPAVLNAPPKIPPINPNKYANFSFRFTLYFVNYKNIEKRFY